MCCNGVWDESNIYMSDAYVGQVCASKITCIENKLVNYPVQGAYIIPVVIAILLIACCCACCGCCKKKTKNPQYANNQMLLQQNMMLQAQLQ